ncbi:GLPGLI family protein [Aureibaculum marinum]|uniref:GLPGLI family protein n=1 Tax=Aureibaculum marinum TaxID=2487930 RepID=A0A3N4P1P2_9FLAO|nr:GLPGLI family protein [Aureibaculum marinum]RPD97749.1 GLPGLI family protein [Aureibaculum marinum]
MKTNIISVVVVAIVLFFTTKITAQKDFQGKAYYQSKTTMDMNFGGRQMSEERKKEIAERMKSMLEKTYTLSFNKSESMYKEDEKLEAPGQGGGRGGRFSAMMGAANGPQYKNIKDSIFLQENELLGKNFLVNDKLTPLEWKMTGETKQIGQYTAFKATAMRAPSAISLAGPRGPRRANNDQASTDDKDKPEEPKMIEVTAWYTMQIPVNQGPGKYWGLPGLILEVHEGNTSILCTKIEINSDQIETIKKPSKGKKVTQAEYDKITKEKMEEMSERFRGGRRGGGRRN